MNTAENAVHTGAVGCHLIMVEVFVIEINIEVFSMHMAVDNSSQCHMTTNIAGTYTYAV